MTIYTATVTIDADDFSEAREKLLGVVNTVISAHGYPPEPETDQEAFERTG